MDIQILGEPIRVRKAVLGFSGWPDAGKVIQQTFSEIKRAFPCESAAIADLDGYWHTEASRPQVTVHHGQIKRLDWPSYQFSLCDPPDSESFLLGMGPEPTMRWRTFARELLQLLEGWECQEVFLLGSLYDQVFHDEVLFSGVIRDVRGYNQLYELGCQPIEYSGPSAVHSAILEEMGESNIHPLSIWSHFPAYLNTPHELLTAHFLHVLGILLDIDFSTRHLMEDWQKRQREIEELIDQDENLREALDFMKQESSRQKRLHKPDSSVSTDSKVVRLDDFLKRRHESHSEEE